MNGKVLLLAVVIVLFAVVVFARSQRKRVHGEDSSTQSTSASSFSVLQGNVDGHPLVAMIDMGLRAYKDQNTLPFFLSLSTPLIKPTSDGLPTSIDMGDLNKWEDAIEGALRKQSKYVFVGRVTWNGNRELLYYTDQQQPTVDSVNILKESKTTRPFAFVCVRDSEWKNAKYWLEHK